MSLFGLPGGWEWALIGLLLCPGIFSFLSFVLLVVFLVKQRPQQVSPTPPTPHIQPSIREPDASGITRGIPGTDIEGKA